MTTDSAFRCGRCGRTSGRLDRPPIPGEAGKEVQQSTCAVCWAEWERMEVMVINELRLNFMDPRAQGILDQHMREFLALDAGAAPDSPGTEPR